MLGMQECGEYAGVDFPLSWFGEDSRKEINPMSGLKVLNAVIFYIVNRKVAGFREGPVIGGKR